MKKAFKVSSDPLQPVFEDSEGTPISQNRAVDHCTCSCGQGLINSRQAAQYLCVSERTLWTITETGLIPRIKMGHCVRYKMDDLVRYIDGLRSESINRNLMKKGAA